MIGRENIIWGTIRKRKETKNQKPLPWGHAAMQILVPASCTPPTLAMPTQKGHVRARAIKEDTSVSKTIRQQIYPSNIAELRAALRACWTRAPPQFPHLSRHRPEMQSPPAKLWSFMTCLLFCRHRRVPPAAHPLNPPGSRWGTWLCTTTVQQRRAI